jgi:hypothetical protein
MILNLGIFKKPMRDTGYRIRDSEKPMLDTGCWMRDKLTLKPLFAFIQYPVSRIQHRFMLK